MNSFNSQALGTLWKLLSSATVVGNHLRQIICKSVRVAFPNKTLLTKTDGRLDLALRP